MKWLWISAFLLLGTCNQAVSDYVPDVCSFIVDSYGLVQPILPKNFEIKGEQADYTNNFAVYQEMYFDYSNSRGKYMYLLNGIEHHFLFDYQVSQVVKYDILHPGVSIKKDPLSLACTAELMEESSHKYIFGYIDDSADIPKMYTSNEAFRFGGPYPYAYNGTDRMSDRGLLVNKFMGCVYDWSMDITMSTNFSFTEKTVVTSGGTLQKDVMGADNGVLSVPVKVDAVGVVTNEDTGNQIPFNTTMSFSWFRGEPEFKMGTFQIPPWMYCKDYRGGKDMAKFPEAFSTRLQVTNFAVDILGEMTATEVTSFEEIYYYKEKNLARRDYTPDKNLDSDIYAKFQSLSPVSTVYDFNEGLLYVTNKATGRCYIRPILQGDFFETSKKLLFIQMGSPEEIFHMQTDDMEYKGSVFERDIDCDVYTGIYNDKTFNATFIKETYIATKGWHEEADDMNEYGVPIKHTILRKELDGDAAEGVSTYNFLKFKEKPPMLYNFDVSNCIETQDYKYFALMLTLSEETRKLIFDYKFHFLEAAQYYITKVSQVMTPLRVQRMQLRLLSISDNRTFLIFVLVDKAKLKTQVVVGQRGASLEEAILFLQKNVEQDQFAIEFYPPGSKEMTLVPALAGNLYVLKPTGELQYLPRLDLARHESEDKSDREDMISPFIQFDDTSTEDGEEEEKGMTPTGLALLSLAMLFIGVGIGIAVMYLYIRHYSEKALQDKINLIDSKSIELNKEQVSENVQ